MEITELLMKEEHPPHRPGYKKVFLALPRILPKLALFATILIVSTHLFHSDPGVYSPATGLQHLQDRLGPLVENFMIPSHSGEGLFNKIVNKEKAVLEILTVLERYPTGLASGMRKGIADLIYEEATRNNQDPKFILALIATESSFQNRSVSQQGAKGLMQIMPSVAQSIAKEMGIEWRGDHTLFNPFINIKMGVYYLSQLVVDFNDFGTALTAYNYGPTYIRTLIEKNEKIPADFYRKLLDAYKKL
jgi:hypothetical protein